MIKLRDILNELKSGKTLSVFDFDDTLVKADHWIYVKHANGKETTLDPGEFAVYNPKPGDTFDFKDFDKMLRDPKIIKKNVELLKTQLNKASASGARKVTILTARKIGYPIKHFFKTLGLDVYVVPVGSSDPQVKANWIADKIENGYTTVYFLDDSHKNVKAVQSLQKQYPNAKIKAVQA